MEIIVYILEGIGLGAVIAVLIFLAALVAVWLDDRKEKRNESDKS